jgi:peptide methionine sulfoxide reductase msrA/msrB
MKEIILGGGCFWCIEADFKKKEGIIDAISGYSGGTEASANYEAVCSGLTDHYEVVLVKYDEEVLSLREVIDYFWTCIDPTNPYGQFADIGTQYKTVIFYENEEEKVIIEGSKKALEESKRFDDPIATLLKKKMPFYPAENYHQDYYKNHPIRYNQYRTFSGRSGFIKLKWGDKRG